MKVDILQTWVSSLSERQSFVGSGPFGGSCAQMPGTHTPPPSLVEGACGPSFLVHNPARVLNTCSFSLTFIYCFWSRWVFIAGSVSVASRDYSLLRLPGFSSWWRLWLQSTGSRRTGFGSGDTRASVAPGRVGSSRTGDRARAPALAGGFLPTAPPGTSLNIRSCPLPRLCSLSLVEAAAQLQTARAFSHATGPPCPEPRMFRLTDIRVCQGSCCVRGSRPGESATEVVWPVTPEKAPGGDWGPTRPSSGEVACGLRREQCAGPRERQEPRCGGVGRLGLRGSEALGIWVATLGVGKWKCQPLSHV